MRAERQPFEHAVALTGGIATGKSTVCNILKLYGFSVIDADKIAHEILDQKSSEIEKIFGKEYVKEGRVDRKSLGRAVFADQSMKKRLEELLHPLIRKEIERRSLDLERYGVPYIVDIPLFFETSAYPIKRVAVVYAPKEQQIERLMKKEGFDPIEAAKRVESQIDIEKKKKLANYLIDNSKDLKHLQKEIEKFTERLKDEFGQI